MSWKCSLRYWHLGPVSWHEYVHALDPKSRRFRELGIGRRGWQVWPPRSVLNPDNEWTYKTEEELVELALWASRRITAERKLARERVVLQYE